MYECTCTNVHYYPARLQLVDYSGTQSPAGVLLDRFGSRALIVSGATLMAAGHFILVSTGWLPTAVAARAVVGLGDAVTFICVWSRTGLRPGVSHSSPS
ncbi:hypothetical protein A4G28_20975 [Mycobacterium ostraviense]|uniref:Major facilitator superfamily (MFS) profile domain-containing protein n=1 Tax=Mycobacterium ostraviense TaxID=2738409 RepID=A0A162E8M0_9MYCO|nr:hypothetical protein A4G28_20975 [Mycobacterium ostraviense]